MTRTPTFLGQAPTGTIDFGIGQPSADLLPVDLLREASEATLREAHPLELTYGVMRGDERFLESLAGYLSDEYGAPVRAGSLFVTGGNSQALDLVSTVFTRPGDTVFVEDPSYYLAPRIFRDHGLKVVGVPADEDGIRVDALEARLSEHVPAFVYVIPSYHNPSGHCMSAERRARLLELSERHGFLIVADEVYQLLHYHDRPPPAFGTMIEGDTVLSLGSFSKILAPALRLGWIQAGPKLLGRILENGFVGSGGCINRFTSHIVRGAIDRGLQRVHLTELRNVYRRRVDVMQRALESELGDRATWQRPDGGYFFWLCLSEGIDTRHLLDRARTLETGFQPGALFSSDGGLGNHLRLSFAHYDDDDIRDGVARMGRLFE